MRIFKVIGQSLNAAALPTKLWELFVTVEEVACKGSAHVHFSYSLDTTQSPKAHKSVVETATGLSALLTATLVVAR